MQYITSAINLIILSVPIIACYRHASRAILEVKGNRRPAHYLLHGIIAILAALFALYLFGRFSS